MADIIDGWNRRCGCVLSSAAALIGLTLSMARPPAASAFITDGCMEDVAGFGLNCTLNDIRIASVSSIVVLDDGCAFDEDGFLDLPNCRNWRQPGSNDVCTSPLQAFPGGNITLTKTTFPDGIGEVEAAKKPMRCRNARQCRGLECCNGICTSTSSDPANCGQCSRSCPAEAPQCCGGVCTNIRSDRNNCGSCGALCPGAAICTDFRCGCDPLEDIPALCGQECCALAQYDACCGDRCANTQRDASNCGSCGNVCTGGKVCQNGACACPPGTQDCNGTCQECCTDADCPLGGQGGQTCRGGQCTCPTDYSPCGGYCCPTGLLCCVKATGLVSCCQAGTTCCFGPRGGGGCCGPDTTCCINSLDGLCCPSGWICCPNSVNSTCRPPGSSCE